MGKTSKYLNITILLLILLLVFPVNISQALSGVPTIILYFSETNVLKVDFN